MNQKEFSNYKELIEKGRIAKLRIWSAMVVMLILATVSLITFLPLPLEPFVLNLIRMISLFTIPVYSVFIFFRIRILIKVTDKINQIYVSFFEKHLDPEPSEVERID